ncbi:MAG: PTS sugar transporter subunit IIA [Anaerostipes sp.]|nr:PTS sugar transporter subunit IIA [Anaerostipes sp.]
MKKRNSDILVKLLVAPRLSLDVAYLLEYYHISQRTLVHDVKEIEEFLKEIEAGNVSIENKAKVVLNLERDSYYVKEQLYNLDSYNYRFSSEERQIYIMMALTVADDYITMEQLARELSVTRITILNDFEEVRKNLERCELTLQVKSSRGGILFGKEEDIRSLIILILEACFQTVHDEGYFQTILIKKFSPKFFYQDVCEILHDYLKKKEIELTDFNFSKLTAYLFVSINRNDKKNFLRKIPDKENPLANNIVDEYNRVWNLSMDEQEKNYLSKVMKEDNLVPIKRTINDIDLYRDIYNFLKKIGEKQGLTLQNDSKLMESLLIHITNGAVSETFDMDYDFSGTNLMEKEIEDILYMIHENKSILEQSIDYKINGKTMYAICIHICASIIRSQSFRNNVNVIVVCPGSVATGRLVEAQLKDYFDFNVKRVVAAYRLEDAIEDDIDFVISTVEVSCDKVPVILVHPFLSIDDLNLVQEHVFSAKKKKKLKGSISEGNGLKHRILAMIQELDENQLEEDLVEQFHQYYRDHKKHGRFLKDMIGENQIQLYHKKILWEDAILKAAVPLIKEEYIEERYIKKAIQNVKDMGPYIIVGEHVAIAHAKPEFGAKKEGFSLLISKEPIVFDGGLEVNLLFCFSTLGELDYSDIFQEIVSFGNVEEKYQRFMNAKKEEEIYKIICE